MFLDSNSLISRATRKLWPLPTFVIPTALGFCFVVSALFGSNLTELVVVLVVAQVIASVVAWKSWSGTHEQLAGVRHELSSLQGIVDVSRDAIIGVTTEGVIMSWNRGARGIYGYTSKEALGAPISMLFDHRRGWTAIDPKGVVGELEYEIGALLRNPIEQPDFFTTRATIERRLEILTSTLPLNSSRTLQWSFAQAVLSAIWDVEDGYNVAPNHPALLLANTLQALTR